jgi:FKBP-type peptidyl-prolyl cis-trans isomerase
MIAAQTRNPQMQYKTASLCLGLAVACVAAGFALADTATTQSSDNTITTPSGLKIVETKPADDAAKSGDQVWVHYVGKLQDGTEFDNSYKRGEPIPLTLGQGSVIKGWEEGLLGMKVGEKRTLIIPPDLAYGADGRPPTIPANSTLVFDVELVGLKR